MQTAGARQGVGARTGLSVIVAWARVLGPTRLLRLTGPADGELLLRASVRGAGGSDWGWARRAEQITHTFVELDYPMFFFVFDDNFT